MNSWLSWRVDRWQLALTADVIGQGHLFPLLLPSVDLFENEGDLICLGGRANLTVLTTPNRFPASFKHSCVGQIDCTRVVIIPFIFYKENISSWERSSIWFNSYFFINKNYLSKQVGIEVLYSSTLWALDPSSFWRAPDGGTGRSSPASRQGERE